VSLFSQGLFGGGLVSRSFLIFGMLKAPGRSSLRRSMWMAFRENFSDGDLWELHLCLHASRLDA